MADRSKYNGSAQYPVRANGANTWIKSISQTNYTKTSLSSATKTTFSSTSSSSSSPSSANHITRTNNTSQLPSTTLLNKYNSLSSAHQTSNFSKSTSSIGYKELTTQTDKQFSTNSNFGRSTIAGTNDKFRIRDSLSHNPFSKEFGHDTCKYNGSTLYKSPHETKQLGNIKPLSNFASNAAPLLPLSLTYNNNNNSGNNLKPNNGYTSSSAIKSNDIINSGSTKLPTKKTEAVTTMPISNTSNGRPQSAYIKPGSGKQKGYLIIFNQEEFAKKEDNRKGSRIDETTICRIFWKFNLSAVVKRNLTFSKIKSEVHKLRVYDFSKYTCFVAVIMSHGHQNGRIYAYDNDFHVDNDFIHPIISNATLKGKPKIFIIAACKGSGKLTENGEYMQTDSVSLGDSQSIPTIRDVLKCFSTYEGFVSYRDPSKGTIFIQTFCDVLDKEGDTLSVEDIMKKVNTRLTEGHASNKQVPTVQSTMSDHFYFGDLLKKY